MGSHFQRTSLNKKSMILCLKTLSLFLVIYGGFIIMSKAFPIEWFQLCLFQLNSRIRTILVSDLNQGNALYRDNWKHVNMISRVLQFEGNGPVMTKFQMEETDH